METFTEVGGVEPLVDYGLNDLSNGLEKANAAVPTATLGDQDNNHPVELTGHFSFGPY